MKDSIKKLYSMTASAALAVIMVLVLIFSCSTLFTIKGADNIMDETYTKGSFTKDITIDRADYGVGTVVSFAKNFKYYKVILAVQSDEQSIRKEEAIIEELKADEAEKQAGYAERELELYKQLALASSDTARQNIEDSIDSNREYADESQKATDQKVAEHQAVITDYMQQITDEMNTLTEEEQKALSEEMMLDEDFIYPLGAWYAFISMGGETNFGDAPEHYENGPFAMAGILSVMLCVMVLVAAVVIVIIVAIKTLIKVIYFATHITKADETVINKVYFGGVSVIPVLMLIFIGFFIIFKGPAVAFGRGTIGLLICYIVANAIRGASKIILADKLSFGEIAKFAINVITVILLVTLIFSFFNIGIFSTTLDYASDYADPEYLYKVEYEKRFEQYKPDEALLAESATQYAQALKSAEDKADYEAWDVVNDTFSDKIGPAIAYDCIALLVIIIAFTCFAERLGAKEVKNTKTGEIKPYGSMPVAAVLLIVCMIIPNFLFTVPDHDKKIESYKAGELKLYFNAFEDEDTKEAETVKLLEESKKSCADLITEADKAINEASDETVKATLVAQREELDRRLVTIEDGIDIMTTSKSGAVSTGITMGIITLILCIAYMIVPKVLDKALAGVFEKKETVAEQTPVTETSEAVAETPAEDKKDEE